MKRTGVKVDSDRSDRVLTILAALLVVYCGMAGAEGFRQDGFVIGFWGDPPVDGQVNARYAEVAEAGFNVVMGGMGASSPALAQRQRDACNRVNIRVLFATYGLPVSALCNCATTYGFLIRDHPSVTELETIRARVEEVRRERPGKLPFINLAPPSTPLEKLGAPDYETYLETVLDALRPEVLCWDEMPWALPGDEGPERYERALGRFREIALRRGVPFWTFVQVMAYGTDHVPSEADIRWQVYTALAYGAKGILYFAYATPVNDPKTRGSGLIDPDGRKTDRLETVTAINRELKRMAAMLFRSTSLGAFDLADADQSRALTENAPVTSGTPAPVTAGVLRDAEGTLVLLLVNRERAGATMTDLTFAVPARELDRKAGKVIPLKDDDAAREGVQVRIAPGDARLVVLGGTS